MLVPIPGAGGVGVGQDLAAAGKLLIRGGEGGAAAARAGEGAAARVGDDLVHACSFAGATPVLMADGTTKPIDQIQVGDKVLATDPETGEQKPETVTHIWIHHDQLTDLDLADGTVLTTTEDHPYWSADDQRFEPASELAPGENVLQANDRVVAVTGLQPITAHDGLAYNLSVHEIHTYHVGNDEILVHNACGDLTHAADCYCNWGEPVIPRPNVAGPADEFTGHALQRLEERGVSAEDASAVLGKEPFSYRHEGQWKLGYYDPNSKVFVAKTIDGNINTVMTDVEQAYVNRLQGER